MKEQRLTPIQFLHKRANGQAMWLFKCKCGGSKIADLYNYRNNSTSSCGCLIVERAMKHGHAQQLQNGKQRNDPTYLSWVHMRQRVLNKNHHRYAHNKKHNITIDPRWDDFSVFLEEMGERPSDKFLYRHDTMEDWNKNNCSWMTTLEGAQFKQGLLLYEIEGKKYSLRQAAKKYNIPHSTLASRINNCNYTIRQAVELDLAPNHHPPVSKFSLPKLTGNKEEQLIQRNKQIVFLIDHHVKLEDAGEHFRITRERARQIYKLLTGHGVIHH